MINRDNVPSDKVGEQIALAAMKGQLIELVEMLSQHGVTTEHQISGWAWSKIEEIDDILKD
ncbi:MAG TPA: hypothetical protein EYN67_12405 [Flavobacteriales bacterium]|nr:hypothetical protein [Methylococcaceae bacterium]HHZ96324.1 hypothetical protein [Flavobacteriales bacterium]